MERRLQIDFTENAYHQLEALQKRLGSPSKSAVIRDALGQLLWLAGEIDAGHRIQVVRDGAPVEILFSLLARNKPAMASGAAPVGVRKPHLHRCPYCKDLYWNCWNAECESLKEKACHRNH